MKFPQEVPLFPLANHVLLPGVRTPYRVFEPCYRALVSDLLKVPEGERWLSLPCLDSVDDTESAAFRPVATLARMTRCIPQGGGEYLIMVEAVARCRLSECPSDKPYRRAQIEALPDHGGPVDRRSSAVDIATLCHGIFELLLFIGDRGEELAEACANALGPDALVTQVAALVINEAEARQAFLEERDPMRRNALVLDAVATHLVQAQRDGFES